MTFVRSTERRGAINQTLIVKRQPQAPSTYIQLDECLQDIRGSEYTSNIVREERASRSFPIRRWWWLAALTSPACPASPTYGNVHAAGPDPNGQAPFLLNSDCGTSARTTPPSPLFSSDDSDEPQSQTCSASLYSNNMLWMDAKQSRDAHDRLGRGLRIMRRGCVRREGAGQAHVKRRDAIGPSSLKCGVQTSCCQSRQRPTPGSCLPLAV